MSKIVFLQYNQGCYLRCTIDQVLSDVDNSPEARLTKVLYERGLISADDVLTVLRLHGEFSASEDEDYYRDREI